MKKIMILCLAALLCGSLAFFACDDDNSTSGKEKITITFKYENYATGNEITIPSAPSSAEIDKGSSLGNKLPMSLGDYTLMGWKDAGAAEVTASTVFNDSAAIKGVVYKTNFAGNLLGDDGKELKDPATGEPVTPPGTGKRLAGTWNWFNSDDSKTNTAVSLALPKPPYKTAKTTHSFPQSNFGGTSTISGTKDEEDNTILRPVTKTVTGPDGNQITVFNFTGTVQVSADNRTANVGSRFPLVGWEAIPDEDSDTLTSLQSAYAYSFCIRVNSASVKANPTANPVNRWVFKTAVCADGFANEQGHEFKHYFGNYQPTAADNFGPNAVTSMTEDLAIGEWYRITVYLNPEDERFNLDQDNYIHQWNKEFEADFDPTTATKLQWQIALQDQSGIGQRNGDPYDIPRGEFEYDFDFFGLELYLPE
jgi:hypothetical protein